jgi:hypothetical protein
MSQGGLLAASASDPQQVAMQRQGRTAATIQTCQVAKILAKLAATFM